MKPSSHNSNPSSPGPFKASVDVAQWRQDVNAFSTATHQMLNSVHQELSNGLARGQAQANIVNNEQNNAYSSASPTLATPASAQHQHADQPNCSLDEVANEGDRLLATLKKQLAQQLSQ